jgi:hypothetical protein
MKTIPTQHHRPLLLAALLAAVALVLTAGVSRADSWILPVAFTQGGGWTILAGAGYGGDNAYEGVGMDGTRRVYWKMDPTLPSVQSGKLMTPGTSLYTISWYRPTSGAADWQPIESQIRGSAGEQWPNDPMIPWAGMWGTSHEYIGAEAGTPGSWVATGPGPHTPESADYNAGANGTMMWLNVVAGNMDQSSWLYAKWDYGWSIDHAWSALMISEVPEPSVMALGLLGGLALLTGFRRGKH